MSPRIMKFSFLFRRKTKYESVRFGYYGGGGDFVIIQTYITGICCTSEYSNENLIKIFVSLDNI